MVAEAGAARADSAPPTVNFLAPGHGKERAPGRGAVFATDGCRWAIRASHSRPSRSIARRAAGTARQHGTARWIDSRQWSYDFDQDLPAGVRCTFTLAPGLKTLKGAGLAEPSHHFIFDTGGPAVVETQAVDGRRRISMSIRRSCWCSTPNRSTRTVLDHAEFSVQGMPQRVGATIMSGADRDLLLKRFNDFINHRPAIILQARQKFPDNAERQA